MADFLNITGIKYGRWTVLGFNHRKDSGKYHYQMWDCLCDCGKVKVVEGTSLRKGNSISCGCFAIERIPRGEKSPQWRENVGYFGLHYWIRKVGGKADKCESHKVGLVCDEKSKVFQWCLLKDKKYERKIENFVKMCRGCHGRYDMTQDTRNKISRTLKNRPSPMKGRKHTLESRKKNETISR